MKNGLKLHDEAVEKLKAGDLYGGVGLLLALAVMYDDYGDEDTAELYQLIVEGLSKNRGPMTEAVRQLEMMRATLVMMQVYDIVSKQQPHMAKLKELHCLLETPIGRGVALLN